MMLLYFFFRTVVSWLTFSLPQCADTEVDNQTKKEREHYLKLVLSRYEKLPESTKLINYCEDRK